MFSWVVHSHFHFLLRKYKQQKDQTSSTGKSSSRNGQLSHQKQRLLAAKDQQAKNTDMLFKKRKVDLAEEFAAWCMDELMCFTAMYRETCNRSRLCTLWLEKPYIVYARLELQKQTVGKVQYTQSRHTNIQPEETVQIQTGANRDDRLACSWLISWTFRRRSLGLDWQLK